MVIPNQNDSFQFDNGSFVEEFHGRVGFGLGFGVAMTPQDDSVVNAENKHGADLSELELDRVCLS